jgi:hypothetical protein
MEIELMEVLNMWGTIICGLWASLTLRSSAPVLAKILGLDHAPGSKKATDKLKNNLVSAATLSNIALQVLVTVAVYSYAFLQQLR